jgi:hypothetical protein
MNKLAKDPGAAAFLDLVESFGLSVKSLANPLISSVYDMSGRVVSDLRPRAEGE